MAFTSTGFQVSITLIDAGNDTCTQTYDVQGADIDAAETNALVIVTDLIPITEAYVLSYQVSEKFANGATRTPAGEIEKKALLSLQLTTPLKKAAMTIPAPVVGIFLGAAGTDAYNQVDPADAALLTFVNDFGTGAQGYVSDGESVVNNGVLKGERISRASRHG